MSQTPLLAEKGAGEEQAERVSERNFTIINLGYCQPST
jgi:hypothetical protein